MNIIETFLYTMALGWDLLLGRKIHFYNLKNDQLYTVYRWRITKGDSHDLHMPQQTIIYNSHDH